MAKLEPVLEQRRWAMHVLSRVLSDGAMVDDALSQVPQEFRSWVHEISAGTLRWKGRLDSILDQLSVKKRPSGAIRKALELATYQLMNQPQVPPAWVVSETVEWVRKKEGENASGFVNAILRKVADHQVAFRAAPWPDAPTSATSPSWAEESRWASLPEWIWRRVVRDHGRDWARAYAEAGLERPQFWVRSRDELPETVAGAAAGPVPESWLLPTWSPMHETEDYRGGKLFVQDISSQILIHDFCLEAARIWGGFEGRSVLDPCAAPGGKSSGLAWNGWRVWATDKQAETRSSQERFRMLRETAKRVEAGLKPGKGSIQVLDRAQVGSLDGVDAAWVDAPCTGSGLLRRHPEVRWIKDERALVSLQREQSQLLREAATKVRAGGLLMYTVCSVLRTDEVDAAVKASGVLSQFRQIREWTLAPHLAPHGDGFSGVLLRRNEE